jgi:hypothetical protein
MASIWEWLVIGVFVFQILVLVGLFFVLRRVQKGPIADVINHVVPIARRVSRLSIVGWDVYKRHKVHVIRAVPEVKGIIEGVKYGTRTDLGTPITYKSLLFSFWKTQVNLLSVRSTTSTLSSMLGGTKNTSTGKSKRKPAPRRSLIDRMGFVPPIARKLHFVPMAWRIGKQVFHEIKRQGLLKR